MKKRYLFVIFLLFSGFLRAQDISDVVRMSNFTSFGSARVSAMGGAFTALGGDISAIGLNPGGIGLFRKSQYSITPMLSINGYKSKDLQNDTGFRIGDLGGVFSFYLPSQEWKGYNIAFTYSMKNNFSREVNQFINNSHYSITDVFANYGFEYDNSGNLGIMTPDKLPTYAKLAYQSGLIYDSGEGYKSILDYKDKSGKDVHEFVNIEKQEIVSGSHSEFNFAIGTNYMDKLYIGGGFGIQTYKYDLISNHTEVGEKNAASGMDLFSVSDKKTYSGSGINFKLGIIYRVSQEFRVGASIISPTYMSLEAQTQSGIKSYWYNNGVKNKSVSPNIYELDMVTPWRFNTGIAGVLGKRAILSLDYEFVANNAAKFRVASDGYTYDGENYDIKNSLKASHNIRLGGEFRLNNMISLRGGYQYLFSPYKEYYEKKDDVLQIISGGLGFNFGKFFTDISYSYGFMRNNSVLFSFTDPNDSSYSISSDIIKNKYINEEIKLTFGWKY